MQGAITSDQGPQVDLSGAMDLDELDLAVVSQLQLDGRRSFRSIARTLDVSEATVRLRTRKLQDSGVLRILAFADPHRLGWAVAAAIFLRVEPANHHTVVEAVVERPEVMYVVSCAGSFDLYLHVVCKDSEQLFEILTGWLSELEGIIAVTALVEMRVHKALYVYRGLASGDGTNAPVTQPIAKPPANDLDEVDLAVVAQLQLDGRRSFRSIARKLDVSEATVRLRVRRLQDSGVLRILGFADPHRLGWAVAAVILLRVEPRHHRDVVTTSVEWPEVMYVVSCAGSFDLYLHVVCKQREQLYDILTRRLSGLEGISEIDTLTEMQVHKALSVYRWLTADQPRVG